MSKTLGLFGLALGLLIVIIWADLNYNFTGYGYVGSPLTAEQAFSRQKSIWDWLELLIIPAVLAGGAFLLNRAERRNEREIAERRIEQEQKIANDRAEAIVLQSYFDRMSEILINKKLRDSDPGSEKRIMARSWTITTLKQLDSERNAMLTSFLQELGLLRSKDGKQPIITLEEADLKRANLREANLVGAHLGWAQLWQADLLGADLKGANLYNAVMLSANLGWADLEAANLSSASLSFADLTSSDLSTADLRNASLANSNLTEANLRGTNLEGAYLSGAQLRKAKYNNATIWPNGFTPPPDAINVDEENSQKQQKKDGA